MRFTYDRVTDLLGHAVENKLEVKFEKEVKISSGTQGKVFVIDPSMSLEKIEEGLTWFFIKHRVPYLGILKRLEDEYKDKYKDK